VKTIGYTFAAVATAAASWRNHALLQATNADPKPRYDNARHYAIQITASQSLDKPRDSSVERSYMIAN